MNLYYIINIIFLTSKSFFFIIYVVKFNLIIMLLIKSYVLTILFDSDSKSVMCFAHFYCLLTEYQCHFYIFHACVSRALIHPSSSETRRQEDL